MSDAMLRIRCAVREDAAAIWRIVEPIVRAGETYALDHDLSEADALALWLGSDRATFVGEHGGEVVGTYYMRPNHGGGGRHVSNCGYMTAPWAAGRGVARAMAGHSLEEARRRGFRAMQFNFVVASNTRAVALWQSLGFAIVGRLPDAFEHPSLGYTDALVMHRAL